MSDRVAFTAFGAFKLVSFEGLRFALRAMRSGAQKSKCPSLRGRATFRPCRQGRVVGVQVEDDAEAHAQEYLKRVANLELPRVRWKASRSAL
jgi:hypothetical protein